MNSLAITQPNSNQLTLNSAVTYNLATIAITNLEDATALADTLTKGCNSQTTKLSYSQAIASFAMFMGGRGLSVSQMSVNLIDEYKSELLTTGNLWAIKHGATRKASEGGLSIGTVHKYLAGVRYAAKRLWAETPQLIDNHTFATIKEMAKVASEDKPLAGDYIPQTDRLAIADKIDQLKGDYQAMVKAIYSLLQLGLRRAEIAALNYDSLKRNNLTVVGKRNKTRVIRFGKADSAKGALMAWLELIPDDCRIKGGAIFFQADRFHNIKCPERISGASIYNIVKSLGCEFTPHDFRRTFVSDCFEAGHDFSKIAKVTGHKSSAMVMRYDRRGEKAEEEVIATVRIY